MNLFQFSNWLHWIAGSDLFNLYFRSSMATIFNSRINQQMYHMLCWEQFIKPVYGSISDCIFIFYATFPPLSSFIHILWRTFVLSIHEFFQKHKCWMNEREFIFFHESWCFKANKAHRKEFPCSRRAIAQNWETLTRTKGSINRMFLTSNVTIFGLAFRREAWHSSEELAECVVAFDVFQCVTLSMSRAWRNARTKVVDSNNTWLRNH